MAKREKPAPVPQMEVSEQLGVTWDMSESLELRAIGCDLKCKFEGDDLCAKSSSRVVRSSSE